MNGLPSPPNSFVGLTHDAFDERLKEMNVEMQDVLDRTQKNQFLPFGVPYSSSTRTAPPTSASYNGGGMQAGLSPNANTYADPQLLYASNSTAADRVSKASPLMSSNLESSISRLCQMEVVRWMDTNLRLFLEPVVQAHVGQQNEIIQRGLQDLRAGHRDVLSRVSDWRSELLDQQNALRSAVQRAERYMNQLKEQFYGDLGTQMGEIKNTISGVEESIRTLKRIQQGEHQCASNRLEESLKQQQDVMHSTLIHVETDLAHWRDEFAQRVRQHVEQLESNDVSLEAKISLTQGALESNAEMTLQHTLDLRAVMDANEESRSQLRMCQRELTRLEMLVHCVTAGGTAQWDMDGKGKMKQVSPLLVLEELAAVKHQLTLVDQRVLRTESRMDNLSDRPPFPVPTVRNGENVAEVSPSVPLRSSCQSTAPANLILNPSSMTAEAPESSGQAHASIGASPLEKTSPLQSFRSQKAQDTSSPIVHHKESAASLSSPLKQAATLPPFGSPPFALKSKSTPVRSGHKSTGLPTANKPFFEKKVAPREPTLEKLVLSTSNSKGEESPAVQETSLYRVPKEIRPTATREGGEENSYVSLTAGKDSAVLSSTSSLNSGKESSKEMEQASKNLEAFPPPPTSDSESDRENHCLTRFSLD